jgi:hypothetical protein
MLDDVKALGKKCYPAESNCGFKLAVIRNLFGINKLHRNPVILSELRIPGGLISFDLF